ncbi:MAG: FAD-binding oxidoreductase [Proteobacteria bacterium]|nr:FAD-binding oxidoreductase [Pseudomonadota bacterium]
MKYTKPDHRSYDVVIVGAAMMGASVAWFLSQNADFDGRILVVEADPTYQWASTSHSNSCLRQQFSSLINIKVSQYGFDYIDNFKLNIADKSAPDIPFQDFGYLYLADNDAAADHLRKNQRLQTSLGAGTQILTPQQITDRFPFFNLEYIILGSHNPLNEGYFDGITVFDWWRRKARENGVEFICDKVIGIDLVNNRVGGVRLASGNRISTGHLVNCAGPRAVEIAEMANLTIPVEPRKRFTFVFAAQNRLDRDLPLTVDPSGVHVRTDGQYYMAGCAPDNDTAVDYTDFDMDHNIWMDKVWPAIATRIPAFETVKVMHEWVGHYAYNTLDQNAIIGPHPDMDNFIFVNGFSGHGLQQAPAIGRGVAEWITYGAYQTLDLSPFSYRRIIDNKPLTEKAVI